MAGAGVTFGFNKSYAGGMVRASVGAYIKVGGFISFERPQIGGSAMVGGHVDASLLGCGFYLVIDTSLSVEVPRPFYVRGTVHLCVGVTIGFWKAKTHIEKCFDVEFKWDKNPSVDLSPVLPFQNLVANPNDPPPLKAINMLSGETFDIAYLGQGLPSAGHPLFQHTVVPLDSWVDLEFLKGLLPGPDVDARIGRLSGQAPANHIDLVPPVEVPHQVKHEYSIKAVEIKAWSGSAWVDYRPYQAMSSPAALNALGANPAAYKDGFWQNTGAGFNKLRLLAETSLSYMEQGQPGWYVPEQFGITSATMFCRTRLETKHCFAGAACARNHLSGRQLAAGSTRCLPRARGKWHRVQLEPSVRHPLPSRSRTRWSADRLQQAMCRDDLKLTRSPRGRLSGSTSGRPWGWLSIPLSRPAADAGATGLAGGV